MPNRSMFLIIQLSGYVPISKESFPDGKTMQISENIFYISKYLKEGIRVTFLHIFR